MEDDSGEAARVASRRHPVALLALLATAPSRTLSRGKLVGYLWPETSEKKARNRLGTCVHQVRSSLGEGVLASVGDDLRLAADAVDCDVWRFREAAEGELEAAVEHYGGPFLDGFRLPDAPAFEKWVERQRTELAGEYHGALERLAEAAEERGEPERAAGWWRKRTNEDPYDSRVVRRLMESLAAAGNRPAALQASQVHRRMVEEELGTAPDPEVEALAERLQRDERGEGSGTVGGEVAGAPETVPGSEALGTGPVETGETGEGEAGSDGPEAPAPAESSRERRRYREPPRRSPREGNGMTGGRLRRIALAAALLLAVAAGAWYLAGPDQGDAARLGDRSIAVLPFEPLGAETSRAVADGLHRDLLTRLHNVSGLDVISSTSVERYRDTRMSTRAIARELGVKWILEGGVQAAGGEIQVNAQLIDTRTDTHAWAEAYRRDLTAERLFDLQAEVTRRIAGALEAEIAPVERRLVEERPTRDLEAFRLFVQGSEQLRRRTDESMDRAVQLFRRAVARDSSYAQAWAGLAAAHVHRRWYGFGPDSIAVEDALEAARRAVELAPDLPKAHATLGTVYMLQHRGPDALRELEQGGSTGWLAWMHATLGQLERGRTIAENYVRLNPHAPAVRATMAAMALMAGRPHEEALEHAREARDLSSGYAWPYLIQGQVLTLQGHAGPAVSALERGLEHASRQARPRHRAWLAMAHAAGGDTARARELLGRIEAGGHPYAEGVASVGIGRLDAAFAAFREAEWNSLQTPNLRYHPALAPLREDPRYGELIERVNRTWGLTAEGALPEEASGRDPGTAVPEGASGARGPGSGPPAPPRRGALP